MFKYQPLKGLQILDFTRLIPGPFCTKILCDLGAHIIKVEDLYKGDYLHRFSHESIDGESVLSIALNKNKSRLKLDFTAQQGKQIIFQLVKESDVLIESYRPDVMKKLGYSVQKLHKLNPKLIYVSLTGYGSKNKKSDKGGHDLNFMAESAFLNTVLTDLNKVTNHKNDLIFGYPFADFVGGGVFAALMILAALLNKTKRRVKLEISMVEALSYLIQPVSVHNKPIDLLEIVSEMARYQVYETKDHKWMALGALEDKFWKKFCDLVSLPQFKDIGFDRKQNKTAIQSLKIIFKSKPARYWKKLGDTHDICLSLLTESSALHKEGYFYPLSLDFEGKEVKINESIFFGKKSRQSYKRAGADNMRILSRLGYSKQKIQELKRAGILS